MRRALALLCWLAAAGLVLLVGLPDRAALISFTVDGVRVGPEVRALAPPFALAALDDAPVRLEDLRGQVVILNFWATWCAPCRDEAPALQALHTDYQPHGLQVVAVNTGEPRDLIRSWVRDYGWTLTVALDEAGAVAALYQLRGQPTTFILSPDGRIAHIIYGSVTYDRLRDLVAPLLPA